MANTDRYFRRRRSPNEDRREPFRSDSWNPSSDRDWDRDWGGRDRERGRMGRDLSHDRSHDRDNTWDRIPPRGPVADRPGGSGSGSGGGGQTSPSPRIHSSLPKQSKAGPGPVMPELRRADTVPLPKKPKLPPSGPPLVSPSTEAAKQQQLLPLPLPPPPLPHAARKGADLLMAILQRCRKLGDLEREKATLDRLSRKREAENKLTTLRETEYPAIANTLKKERNEDEQKNAEVAQKLEHTRTELSRQCRELLYLLAPRSDGRGSSGSVSGSPSPVLEQGRFADKDKAAQENVQKLRAAHDETRAAATTLQGDVATMRDANTALEKRCADLQTEMATLRAEASAGQAGMAKLADLVNMLTKRLDGVEAAREAAPATGAVGPQNELATLQATLTSLQGKVDMYDRVFSEVDPALLLQMGDFFALGRKDMAKDIAEQKDAVAALQTQMAALQEVPAAAAAAAAAPSAAPAAAPDGSPIAFPGDDFVSVRIEIGRLNEKLAALASLPGELAALTKTQAKLMATQTDNMERVYRAHDKLAETFGKLLNEETMGRKKDMEEMRLAIQGTVEALSTAPAAAASATEAPAAPAAPEEASPAQAPDRQWEELADRLRQLDLEMHERYASLQMMVTTLDTQYNNLSTKELFTAIIGHMEKLCPNARQLQQDVAVLNRRLRQLESMPWATSKRPFVPTTTATATATAPTTTTTAVTGSQESPADQAAKRRKLNEESAQE